MGNRRPLTAVLVCLLFTLSCGRGRPLGVGNREVGVNPPAQTEPCDDRGFSICPTPTPFGSTPTNFSSVVHLQVDPPLIPAGGSARLSYEAVSTERCTLSQDGQPLNATSSRGSFAVGPFPNATESPRVIAFQLRCGNREIADELIVQPTPRPDAPVVVATPPPPSCAITGVVPPVALPGVRRTLQISTRGVINQITFANTDPSVPVAQDGTFTPRQSGSITLRVAGPSGVASCVGAYRVYEVVVFHSPRLQNGNQEYIVEECDVPPTADFYCRGKGFIGSSGHALVAGISRGLTPRYDASVRGANVDSAYWVFNWEDGVSADYCSRIDCYR